MVGVPENNLRVESFKVLLGLTFYCCSSSNRHERRCFNDAVRRSKASEARTCRVRGENFEMKCHRASLSGGERGDASDDNHPKEPKAHNSSDRAAGRYFLWICGVISHPEQNDDPQCE